MATYEWVLATPTTREFAREVKRIVEYDEPAVEAGVPVVKKVTKELSETVRMECAVNLVRLLSVHNDHHHHRLFVRFFYGRMENGQFVTPVLDDGIVFSGPTYLDHEFHTNPSAVEELTLLKKVAATLKWDGQARELVSKP
jgi:hypothetical protein